MSQPIHVPSWTAPRTGMVFLIGVVLISSVSAWGQARPPAGQGAYGGGGNSNLATSLKATLKSDALIQFDVDTNTLIVVTDEETNAQISKVVEALDQPVPEVLIKVLFLEVTHTNSLDLGADIKNQHNNTRLVSPPTILSPFSTQVDTQLIQSIFGAASQTTGGVYGIVGKDLNATIEALAEVTKLEVLSRPSILTKNNKEATITIGQSIPLVSNSRVTDTGQTINTLTYQDVGIILDVTPQVMDNDMISLQVAPQISQLTGESVPVTDTATEPIISMRSAQTFVEVPDGKTVVIGGLMQDNKTKDTKKVPLLGDIPLIGNLFKRQNNSKTKTELLIFLTPHVIRGAEELTALSTSEQKAYQLGPKAFHNDELKRYIHQNWEGDPVLPPQVKAAPLSEAAPTPAPQEAATPDPQTPPQNKGKIFNAK